MSQDVSTPAADAAAATAPTEDRRNWDEWRRVENTLRASDEKYRLLVENANESIFITQDGAVRFPNPKMLQMLGYSADELSQMPFTDIIAPDDRDLVQDRHLRRIRGDSVPTQYRFRCLRRNGEPLWVELNAVRIDWEGRPAALCFVRDISEQKAAEAALRDSQALYHSLVEGLPFELVRKDLQGRFTFGNRRFCEFVGHELADIIGRTDHDFFPADLAAKYAQDDRYVAETGATFEGAEQHQLADGRVAWVQLLKTPVYDSSNNIIGTQCIFWDITERRQAEEALERAREMAEREHLEREVAEISARERQRISQDLHDSVGQELTGLNYVASRLKRRLDAQQSPEAEAAADVMEGIQRTLRAVRSAIRGLTPVEVDANGLMVALEQLASDTARRCNIPCDFECDRPAPVDNNDTATQLFRIAQESVYNAVKHSGAARIVVRLESRGGKLRLSVTDDGAGLPAQDDSVAGMGLRIMKYRAAGIHGVLNVTSASGRGTQVVCTLPVEAACAQRGVTKQ